ncbi:MAG: histidine kinase [Sinomicrobium sp.]|nr:histidine kinase [Sinomicrobium sp.]
MEKELKNIAVLFMYSFVLTAVNAVFFDIINTKTDWKKNDKKRILYGAAGGVLLTMAALTLCRYIHLVHIENAVAAEHFFQETPAEFYVIGLIITITVTLFYHAFYFYKALQEKKVKEQKIIAGTASAKFDALKNQLDPHFLFNSLNVLASLISEDPEKAQRFTTSLSKIYRYVLEQKNKELVPVAEELLFAKTYVSLLKMRFEDSIIFSLPENVSHPEAKVVPLSLQLLLENAVKHNSITPAKPLRIRIYEKDGCLLVANNLQAKQVVKKSSGVGLGNIHQRYHLLTDRQVRIEKTASEFTVSIPILTEKTNVMNKQETHISGLRYKRAKEKVDALKSFYTNIIAYCIIMSFLALLNYMTNDFPWVIFPAAGWGLGIIFRAMKVYGYHPVLGKGWEERKMKQFMDNERFGN